MPRSLDIALSPYHLATREAPAMLALILGSRIVTLMPHPAAGSSREAVKAAVDAAPRYLRLMESWRWSGPLWQSGVIASGVGDDEAAADLAEVYADIDHADALAALRPLTRAATQRAAESPDRSLDLLAADVLKGGPDPGINIPIAAALDRFAVRHGLAVVRGGTPSIAQRAESRLAKRVFSMAMPILLRAGGGRIERLREDLARPLNALRAAMHRAGREALDAPDQAAPPLHAELVTRTGAAYAQAFDKWSAAGGTSGDDENRERVVPGYVSVTGQVVPADAVLRASRAALRAIQTRTADDEPLPEAASRLFILTVREMTVRPG